MLESKEDQEKLAYALGMLASLYPIEATIEQQAALSQVAQQAPIIAQNAFLAVYRQVSSRLEDLIAQVGAGSADVVDAMQSILEPAYQQVSEYGKFAAGRLRPLSAADIEEVTKQWAQERSYVNGLERDLKSGAASPAEAARRIRMYGYALREVYNRAWVHHKNSPVFKWHMHDGAVHCTACILASGGSGSGLPAGFYRVNELPFYPGRSPVCLDNCMCWLEAADGDTGAPQVREPASSGDNPV